MSNSRADAAAKARYGLQPSVEAAVAVLPAPTAMAARAALVIQDPQPQLVAVVAVPTAAPREPQLRVRTRVDLAATLVWARAGGPVGHPDRPVPLAVAVVEVTAMPGPRL
jgi:hypothetical protein